MKLQGELKSFKSKALVSGDKGIELKIYVNANTGVDTNKLHEFLLEPIEVEIKKDGTN